VFLPATWKGAQQNLQHLYCELTTGLSFLLLGQQSALQSVILAT
jgi:hypothetical protein